MTARPTNESAVRSSECPIPLPNWAGEVYVWRQVMGRKPKPKPKETPFEAAEQYHPAYIESRRKKIHRGAKFNYDFVELACRLKAAGFSDEDLAYAFGVHHDTIRLWRHRFPEFKKACEDGKKMAVQYLVARGLRAAAGYEYEEANEKYKTVFDPKTGETKQVLVGRSVFKKYQPPDARLLMFMLSNLDPENWAKSHKIEVDENRNINIRLQGEVASDQIRRLAGAFLNQSKEVESKVIEENVEGSDDGHKNRES